MSRIGRLGFCGSLTFAALAACAPNPSDVTVQQNAPVIGTAAPVAGCSTPHSGPQTPSQADTTNPRFDYAQFSTTPSSAPNNFRSDLATAPACY